MPYDVLLDVSPGIYLFFSLSNLPLQIFGHIAPKDLVNVSRTNKAFRTLLMSADAKGLWRESFNQLDDYPPCPEDVSHRAWAHVLYGGNFCHVCLLIADCDV